MNKKEQKKAVDGLVEAAIQFIGVLNSLSDGMFKIKAALEHLSLEIEVEESDERKSRI